MSRQVLLLRGVNVGGHNRLPMDELRLVLEARLLAEVKTHLQSGNVLVASDLDPDELADICRTAIAEELGVDVPVMGRTGGEIAAVVAADPLGELAEDSRRYLVTFLSEPLSVEPLEQLKSLCSSEERLVSLGRELYSWHPDGIGRSKLWAALTREGTDHAGSRVATARNWRTVSALAELALA